MMDMEDWIDAIEMGFIGLCLAFLSYVVNHNFSLSVMIFLSVLILTFIVFNMGNR